MLLLVINLTKRKPARQESRAIAEILFQDSMTIRHLPKV